MVSVIIIALVVIVGVALWRQFFPTPGAGDPGNARLHVLENDAVINAVPPRSRRSRHPLIPCRDCEVNDTLFSDPTNVGYLYVTPTWWDGYSWQPPEVQSFFYSSLTYGQVFAYYDRLATAHGWTVMSRADRGFPQAWQKTYPSGYQASFEIDGGSMSTVPPLNKPGTTLYGLTSFIDAAG